MERIGTIIPLFNFEEKKSTLNKRSLILKEFETEINNERERLGWGYYVGKKWTKTIPITGKELAIRLAHVKDTEELFYFLSKCRDYKNRQGSFQKAFFGSLKLDKKK